MRPVRSYAWRVYHMSLPDHRRLAALFILASTLGNPLLSAQSTGGSSCVVRTSSAWGAPSDRCNVYRDGYKRDHSGTFTVEITNTCPEVMEVKAAMQEQDGVWRTFPARVLAPGESFRATACQGNGRYMYWTKRLDDPGVMLPSDAIILSEFREQ